MEVAFGGIIAVLAGLLGGLGGVLTQGYLDRKAEHRREERERRDRVRQFRADRLTAAYRSLIAVAEHTRATVGGESPEQIARLRTQTESTANLGADASLFRSAAAGDVKGFVDVVFALLELPVGGGITREQVSHLAAWEARLHAAYVAAMERLLAEV